MPSITANGISIAYQIYGVEDGIKSGLGNDTQTKPWVVLIHGLGVSLVGWPVPLIDYLVAKGFAVLTFDNRDCGQSEILDQYRPPNLAWLLLKSRIGFNPSAPYKLFDMAVDTISLLDALKIKTAHIVGVSMGGMISQLIAIHYPSRVLSLSSIMSTTGRRSLPSAKMPVVKHLLSKPVSDSLDDRMSYHLKKWRLIGSPKYPSSEQRLKNIIQGQFDRGLSIDGTKRQSAAILATPSRVEALQSLQTPTLVIHGNADPLVPLECGIDTAKSIKNAKLEIIEGMGHDFPEALIDKVALFIGLHILAKENH